MNGALLLCIAIIYFVLAYVWYGGYLKKLFGVDPSRTTPAHTLTDGVDYVPTKSPVLFGHHFASIAGAGPIVGPIAAAYFGWAPVVLWILLGCVFVGAMHDFAALLISVRDGGRSIGHVIETQLGYVGRQIFLLFSWAALMLVVAVFAVLVAGTFVKMPSVATASLLFIAMAPVFGFLVYKCRVGVGKASAFFVPLLFFFVYLGQVFPLDVADYLSRCCALAPEDAAAAATKVWLGVLGVYVFVASVIPVWVLLQPRDYLNSYLLYAMVLLGFVGILFSSPSVEIPAFTGWVVPKDGIGSPLFPLLFVTVACGACSGFHALVASGTTAKQLDTERHLLPVGYGSMLVEGVLAIMALVSVAYLGKAEMGARIAEHKPIIAFAMGLSHFCEAIHIPSAAGKSFFALAISAFLLTTLDTATRLGRFAWQELFLPRQVQDRQVKRANGVFSNRFVATAIVLLGAGCLALMQGKSPTGETMAAWRVIWPIFGASNQLLAALTLLVITLILMRQKRNFWIALFPMVFMMCVCFWALVNLLVANVAGECINWPIVIATVFLLAMAVVLILQSIVSLRTARKG